MMVTLVTVMMMMAEGLMPAKATLFVDKGWVWSPPT
jgi:hypothetical protein